MREFMDQVPDHPLDTLTSAFEDEIQTRLLDSGFHHEDITTIVDAIARAQWKTYAFDQQVAYLDSGDEVKLVYPESRTVKPSTIAGWYRDAVADRKVIEGDERYITRERTGKWYNPPSLEEMAAILEDIGLITRGR